MNFQADFASQNFASQDYFRNPAAAIERPRAQGPVVRVNFPIVGKVWATTTQALADRVLKDTETFTIRKDDGTVAGMQWWMPKVIRALANSMLSMDDPGHKRLRDIVDEAFRRRAVLGMEPHIQAIGDKLADELFAEGSPCDLVDRYARKLPLSVISELLGLPPGDRTRFIAWAGGFTRFTGMLGFFGAIPNMLAMRRYMERHVETVRQSGGEELIAEIVRVEKEGGQISRDEIVAMIFLLLFAGHETTSHLISGSAYELLKNPDLRNWLEQDWSRLDLAVEEFLRFVTPVQFTKPRYVRRDVELDGIRLRKGDKVMAMLAAANWDPLANAHPERLDLQRRPNRHIAFGTGIHFCLGHQLARLEAKCALKSLFQRWPGLKLAVDESEIRWRQRPGLNAIERLAVEPGSLDS
ncbi:cytochrome P450 [Bradyrhizobium sp. KBS0727]|uniref:cytochrome P450 n=1 Tax=unclassified Bradyrhizobium TaxID=2631580 RepID=UPI00110D3CC3|nr:MULTISPECIES: cytochrome P450 [unclassified Bradyrhizobium]QDW38632.1 cytochrome P450 [Bradyrhizobium sp. KBS0725]QDW45236.1 cytochrome P450 [Bradyrhizobium sp. KBS0727]